MNFLPLSTSVLAVIFYLYSFGVFGLPSPRCHLQYFVLFCDSLQIFPCDPSHQWQWSAKMFWWFFQVDSPRGFFSYWRYDNLWKAAEKNRFHLRNFLERATVTFGEELQLPRWDLFAELFCVILCEGGEGNKFGWQLWKNEKAQDYT